MTSSPSATTAATPPPPRATASKASGLTDARDWVLIVGASSGIGRAVARQWASSGNPLILAGRDTEDLDRCAADLRIRFGSQVNSIHFDALAFHSHGAFWRECQALAGGALSGVILLHGYLPSQADAQNDLALMQRTIDTNFTSAVSLLSLAANDFEQRRQGFLCVFSSVAGDRGRQSNYLYGSAKAGLTTFLAGLRNRLFKSGVSVTTVKPGFVDTAMTWGLPGLFLVAKPEQVAEGVYDAVKRRAANVYTPWFWRYIMLIIRSIPERVFVRMKM